MDTVCKNCDRKLVAEYAYCPDCGQNTHLHRLSWHELGHELVHYFTHADKGIFQLVRDLAVQRGKVALQYVNGKRRKFFPPLNFFLIIAAISVISASWKADDGPIDVMKTYPRLAKIQDKERLAQITPIYERSIKVTRFTAKYANVMAMAALPISAFIYFLFYVRGRYNYVEHLVAGMYMLGFCILVYALVILPIGYLFGLQKMHLAIIFGVFQMVYGADFYFRFMERKRPIAYLFSALAGFTGFIVWSVISVSVIQLYIRTGFIGLLH